MNEPLSSPFLRPLELRALRQSHAELASVVAPLSSRMKPPTESKPKRQITLQSLSTRPRRMSRLRKWLMISASLILVADIGLACAWLVKSMRADAHAVTMMVVTQSAARNAPVLHKEELEALHHNGPLAEQRDRVASEASRVCRASIQDRFRPLGRQGSTASRNARVTKAQRSSAIAEACTM